MIISHFTLWQALFVLVGKKDSYRRSKFAMERKIFVEIATADVENIDEANEPEPINSIMSITDHSTIVLWKKRSSMASEGRCENCYMFRTYCICCKVQANFASIADRGTSSNSIGNINFSIYLHFKEWGRSSNTGKVLQIGQPKGKCYTAIYGQPDQEQILYQSLQSSPSFVLYPSSSSRPISDYAHLLSADQPLQLCVIDSTWPQSYAMEKAIPANIPRVHIDEWVTGPSQFLNRKQTSFGRVSTLEAVMMALTALGATPDDLLPYQLSLEYCVDAVLQQSGKVAAYGNYIQPYFGDDNRITTTGPAIKPSIDRPTQCPCCNALGSATSFKNLGVRKKAYLTDDRVAKQEMYMKLWESMADEENGLVRIWRCKACSEHFPVREGSSTAAN